MRVIPAAPKKRLDEVGDAPEVGEILDMVAALGQIRETPGLFMVG